MRRKTLQARMDKRAIRLELTSWIPSAQYHSPVDGIFDERIYYQLELVNASFAVVTVTVRIFGTEVPPLKSINRAQIAWREVIYENEAFWNKSLSSPS